MIARLRRWLLLWRAERAYQHSLDLMIAMANAKTDREAIALAGARRHYLDKAAALRVRAGEIGR